MQKGVEKNSFPGHSFGVHSPIMGGSKQLNRHIGQQQQSRSNSVFGNNINLPIFNFERIKRMATVKLALIISDMLGITAFFLGILTDFGDFKSILLSSIGGLWVLARFVFYCINKYQNTIKSRNEIREQNLRLWHLEMDKKQRELKMNQPDELT